MTKQRVKNISKQKNKRTNKGLNKRNKKHSLVSRVANFLVVAAIWSFVFVVLLTMYFLKDLPDVSVLGTSQTTQRSIKILDKRGDLVAVYGNKYSYHVEYTDIPYYLTDAILSTEDKRFFEHIGIDFFGITRAIITNLSASRVVQGGSTITQQLAKLVFLSHERTIKRKIQELIFTLYLEYYFNKEDIFTMYINRVYMGSGIYGVGNAAKYYFDKHVSQLDIYESATLAGLLKAPTRYSPVNHADLSSQRTYQIILNMYNSGYATKEELDSAKNRPVILATNHTTNQHQKNYYTDWIIEQIPYTINDTESDLVVHTTYDSQLQEIVNQEIQQTLNQYQISNHVSQSSVVVMNPDGAVLSMIGGKNYRKSEYNRAIHAQRQPGSAFKVFVYANAFEHGIKPNDVFIDEPITINKWQPRNSNRKYIGEVTVKDAFAHSINTVTVQLSEKHSKQSLIKLAHMMGINDYLIPHPSIALGASEVTLLDLTTAFSVFNNHGYPVYPYGITKILHEKGKFTLYEHKIPHNQQPILHEGTVKYMDDLMKSVVSYGTASRYNIQFPAALKTGTSQDFRDAWCIGYSGDITVGIWMGNDDNSPMIKVGGAGLPTYMWTNIMTQNISHNRAHNIASGKQHTY